MTELCHGRPVVRLPKKRESMMATATDRTAMTTTTKQQQQQQPPSFLREALVSDRLYTEEIPSTVSENDIMDLVQSCDPVEVKINRIDGTGYIQFPSIDKADRAYTLFNDATLKNQVPFQLKIAPGDYHQEPEATSGIYQIRNLPLVTTNNYLYELFRPFGPMNLCKIIMDQGKGFKGTALVQYFDANDAEMAVKTMNNKSIQGNTIVFPFVSKKGRPHSSEVMMLLQQQQQQQQLAPPPPNKALNGTSNGNNNNSNNNNGGGGVNNGGTVDYTNLYIKNLDLQVRSCDLFKHFRNYGHIISARVMRNPETDQSKGFGFVSFSRAEEAQRAREEMNNKYILSKPIIVAFHEPKKPRTEKNSRSHDMVRRFSTPGIPPHPPPPYVSVVPTIPEYIDYSKPSPQPGAAPTLPALPPPPSSRRPLTTSSNNANEKFPGVKKRHSTMTHVPAVSAPVTPATIHGSPFAQQQHHHNQNHSHNNYQHHPHNHNQQHHPIQKQPQQTKPPALRRRSSNESASSAMTETTPDLQKHRMTDAVLRVGIKHNVEDIVFMLLTLKRKERSLCLFNQDFLKEQIKLAKSALEIFKDDDDDDDGSTGNASPPTPVVAQPPLPITITAPPPTLPTTPTLMRVSRAIPIVAPQQSSTQTVSSTNLDKLARIAPDTIDKFLASLEGLPLTQQKEKLGDQLFPHVKATGVRHAPKITVRLLDTVPLDELARTMHDKVALKTKVDAAVASLQQ